MLMILIADFFAGRGAQLNNSSVLICGIKLYIVQAGGLAGPVLAPN